MISLPLARALKRAGLRWQPGINDFFAIPDRQMDDRLFVISDMMAHMELVQGWPMVAFHGASEWALDYILTTEVVWMPTETQLRALIEEYILGEEEIHLHLALQANGRYLCAIRYRGEEIRDEEQEASDAYGQVLLALLQRNEGAHAGSSRQDGGE